MSEDAESVKSLSKEKTPLAGYKLRHFEDGSLPSVKIRTKDLASPEKPMDLSVNPVIDEKVETGSLLTIADNVEGDIYYQVMEPKFSHLSGRYPDSIFIREIGKDLYDELKGKEGVKKYYVPIIKPKTNLN